MDVDGTVLRYYDTLDTEGGSSGSPIFRDADDKLIGLHHCGGCSSPGVGNRGMLISDIYPFIQDYLCPEDAFLSVEGSQNLQQVAGNGDPYLDPGETWSVLPSLTNESCDAMALGATADVQVNPASTMPIAVLTPTIQFGDIPGGQSATGLSPIRFRIGRNADCAGASVVLDLVNLSTSTGGPFEDGPAFFSAPMGGDVFLPAFFDNFSAGPGSWIIQDGGTGSGPAETWTTDNPGGRSLALTAPFFIVDSEAHGSGETMDENLVSPLFSTVGLTELRLEFNHDFNWSAGGLDEVGTVSIRSPLTLGGWVDVATYQGGDASGFVSLDVDTLAAGQTNVQVRFRYSNAEFEGWWAVDDVNVIGNGGIGCHPFNVRPRGLIQKP